MLENVELFKEKLNEKNLDVLNNISEFHLVKCDNNMLNTIIRNLIYNAIKFSFVNSTIEISSTCNEEFCTILVKDEGIGIENNNFSKLFKVESDDTTLGTNNEKGTGIGLALRKEFAQKKQRRNLG